MSEPYDPSDAEAILRKAVERQFGRGEGLSEEELAQVAAEAGVSTTTLRLAQRDVWIEKEIQRARSKRTRGLKRRWIGFGIVTGALALADFMLGGGWFVHWVALVWGAALGMSTARVLLGESEEEAVDRVRKQMDAAEAEQRAREEAARAEAERRAGRGERRRELIGELVEDTMDAVLGAASARMKKVAQPVADTEFNRYAAQADGRAAPGPTNAGAGGPSRPAGPQVRVAKRAEDLSDAELSEELKQRIARRRAAR